MSNRCSKRVALPPHRQEWGRRITGLGGHQQAASPPYASREPFLARANFGQILCILVGNQPETPGNRLVRADCFQVIGLPGYEAGKDADPGTFLDQACLGIDAR